LLKRAALTTSQYDRVGASLPKSFHFINPAPIERSFESVVAMATYANDNPAWLQQAIDSILVQDYTNFLFVIVIDGPVGENIETLVNEAAKRDSRIAIARSEVNVGLSRCMNFVMDWCLPYQPKYFFRMDADDVSMPQRISKQVAFLQSREDVQVLGSALVEINEEGKQVGARSVPQNNKKIKRTFTKRCGINHPTVCMRFELLEQGYRYRDDLSNTQDYFLWVELLANGVKFHNIQEPLLKFRRVNNFYKRRGFVKSVNEFKARIYAMRAFKRVRIRYLLYAVAVFLMRCLPPFMVKLVYKFERYVFNNK
jgi:glycosyltransferase involved in cell wall biosynthesis